MFTHGVIKRAIPILIGAGILLTGGRPAVAFEKTGTTAATFLQIPVGARLPGMGGAGVGLTGGPELLATNPAAAFSAGDGIGVSISNVDWIAGLKHQSASLILPTLPTFALGLNIISFGGDEFEQTTLDAQEGNGIMVDYGDLAVGATMVARLTDRFTVGVTGTFIHQSLFNETASTVAFDVGTMLLTSLQGFSIGMAMTHLGGEMQLQGRDLLVEPGGVSGGGTRYETSAWPLPLTFQTGVAWRLLGEGFAWQQNRVQSFTVAADARHINEGITTIHLGGEFGVRDTVFLRAGRTIGHDTEQWAFGGGVKVNLYSYSVRADLAYADLGDLDAVQRVTITIAQRIR
ncbi:MAG: PorV/PorQ family protein [bacterium]